MRLRKRRMTGLSGHHPLFLKAWSPTFKGISSFPFNGRLPQGTDVANTVHEAALPALGCDVSWFLTSWWDTAASLQAGICFRSNIPISINCCLELVFSPDQHKLGSSSKVSCSPVLPLSDSDSVQKPWGLPQILQKPLIVQESLATGWKLFFFSDNSMFKTRRHFSRDAVWGKWLCLFLADCQISHLNWY